MNNVVFESNPYPVQIAAFGAGLEHFSTFEEHLRELLGHRFFFELNTQNEAVPHLGECEILILRASDLVSLVRDGHHNPHYTELLRADPEVILLETTAQTKKSLEYCPLHLAYELGANTCPRTLAQLVNSIMSCRIRLKRAILANVGLVGVKELTHWVRRTMLLRAWSNSGYSKRATAKILGISRPAVQQMLASPMTWTSGHLGKPTLCNAET